MCRLGYLQSDIVAGLAVGLTAIPQSIAYAKVAGLEPQVMPNVEFLKNNVKRINMEQ